jgi:predicted ATP-grasp superfamily ATP-dependent carboligase
MRSTVQTADLSASMSRVLIVGASARAAAASAERAGLDPWCADLFADADLRAACPNAVRCPIEKYPAGLLDLLRDAPAGPLMYTGGLENHPNLVWRLAEVRPLWGNGPNALRRCRWPFTVEHLLRNAGLPAPEVHTGDAELPGFREWVRKPIRGAAGQGIALVEPSGRAKPQAPRRPRALSHYYQQFVPGPSMSAVFVRARGEVRLLGVTEQLIGAGWVNAPPFRYAGNIGPVDAPPELRDDLIRVGRTLGEGCELVGLFGVDFIYHEGRPWVVEINPRYPASVEVLERATGLVALAHHRTAFDPGATAAAGPIPGGPVAGKAILYAPRRLVMPDGAAGALAHLPGPQVSGPRTTPPQFADIPHAREVIEAGWPIMTVLADGSDRSECLATLRSRVVSLERVLFGVEPRPVPPGQNWYAGLDDELGN